MLGAHQPTHPPRQPSRPDKARKKENKTKKRKRRKRFFPSFLIHAFSFLLFFCFCSLLVSPIYPCYRIALLQQRRRFTFSTRAAPSEAKTPPPARLPASRPSSPAPRPTLPHASPIPPAPQRQLLPSTSRTPPPKHRKKNTPPAGPRNNPQNRLRKNPGWRTSRARNLLTLRYKQHVTVRPPFVACCFPRVQLLLPAMAMTKMRRNWCHFVVVVVVAAAYGERWPKSGPMPARIGWGVRAAQRGGA